MKIIFTAPIANRRRGEVADLEDGSAAIVIGQGYAEPFDHGHANGPTPSPAPDPDPTPAATGARTRARTSRNNEHTA